MRAIGLTLLACLMLLAGQAWAFDPTASMLVPPPRDFAQLARENSIIVASTTWITNWEEAKRANPNVENWDTMNLGIMWYNHNSHNDDPFEQGGFIEWHPLQQWSIDARMTTLVQENLKLGVDWFVRDRQGKPLKAYGLPTAAVLNTTESCPRSRVPGPFYNCTVMEAYAKILAELANDPRYRAAVDVMYFDMGGNLWSTLWELRHSNMLQDTWDNYDNGWITAYRYWVRAMDKIDFRIHINANGESWIWPDQNGNTHNHYWVDGYKMENPFAQGDWRQTLPYEEQFRTWLGPYIRYDARGSIRVGLRWMQEVVGSENIVIQAQGNTTWSQQENRRHSRMCLATWLLAYEKDKGPRFSFDTYWDTNERVDLRDFPEVRTWTQMEPTDAPLYTRDIGGKTLYLRKMKLAGRWNVLLITNPNEEWVYGVPPKDAMILILDMLGFQQLMQWHRVL